MNVTITSLGGFGEVTRNMYCYETDEDIMLVDCGIGFPTEEMLGIDILIPDVSYLKGKENKIRGMILTHGHEDHIGALPYILPELPEFPIYTAKLTAALAQEKLKEYGLHPDIRVIDSESEVKIGGYTVRFARVGHSIPDTMHLRIMTPVGMIYHGADFKFDLTPIDGVQPELHKIADAGNQGVRLLISDCLGSERPGATPSERILDDTFERELMHCRGKFIVTTMSSSISRLQQAIKASIKMGRKIVLSGRSLEKNIMIATKAGYLDLDQKHLVPSKAVSRYKDNELTFLVAGSQGQEGSALYRIAVGEHSYIKAGPGDHVVFSTDYIPGSETAIHSAIDALYELGATVTYADIKDNLHVSGHGSRHDLKLLINLTDPEYFYPIGGTLRHVMQYSLLAEQMGYDPKRVMIPRGKQIVIDEKQVYLGKQPGVKNIMVDGLGVGDVGKIVLRDRQVLAEEGLVIVLMQFDKQTQEITPDIDIITRGLVYLKSNDSLLEDAKDVVLKKLESNSKVKDWHTIKKLTSSSLQRFFDKRLQRQPMIIPVVIEV